MFELTLDGLKDAIKSLKSRPTPVRLEATGY
jgi:hypothetical protein